MRFGVQLGVDAPTAAEDLVLIARAAEDLGFESLWLGDHLVIPAKVDGARHANDVGGSQRFADRSTAATSEPITSLAFLCGHVERLRLGTAVLIVPLRNPVLTAKMLASVDRLSGGRLDVGVGAGWIEDEFEALRTPPFPERGAVTDDYLDTIVALWTQDEPDHVGPHYAVSGVAMFPKPIQQPHPPIWVGGNSAPAMRRAARIGQGWLPLFQDPGELPKKRAELAQLCEEVGREPGDVRIAVGCRFGFAEGLAPEARPLLSGTAGQMRDDVRRYADAGVEELHLITAVPGASASTIVDGWWRFADEVATRC